MIHFIHSIYNRIAGGNLIHVDNALSISLILEGYGGLDATYGCNYISWLTKIIFAQTDELMDYLNLISPHMINSNLDYILITQIMINDGYITEWADYGTTKDNWILKLPLNYVYLSINPYLNKIHTNNIATLYKINS